MATCGEQSVCYSSYVDDIGRKSTSIKAKDPLHEGLLLNWIHLEVDRPCLMLRADTLEAALDCCTRDFIELRSFTLAFYAF